jgi:hypothetical protein
MALNPFRSLVQGLVQTAIQITGDLAEPVVYTQVTGTAYDTTTGQTTQTTVVFGGPGQTPLMGIFSRFQENEVEGRSSARSEIRIGGENIVTDAKITFAYLDLPILPDTSDTLTVQGRTWKPVRVLSAPGSPVWTIHIRVI